MNQIVLNVLIRISANNIFIAYIANIFGTT